MQIAVDCSPRGRALSEKTTFCVASVDARPPELQECAQVADDARRSSSWFEFPGRCGSYVPDPVKEAFCSLRCRPRIQDLGVNGRETLRQLRVKPTCWYCGSEERENWPCDLR